MNLIFSSRYTELKGFQCNKCWQYFLKLPLYMQKNMCVYIHTVTHNASGLGTSSAHQALLSIVASPRAHPSKIGCQVIQACIIYSMHIHMRQANMHLIFVSGYVNYLDSRCQCPPKMLTEAGALSSNMFLPMVAKGSADPGAPVTAVTASAQARSRFWSMDLIQFLVWQVSCQHQKFGESVLGTPHPGTGQQNMACRTAEDVA